MRKPSSPLPCAVLLWLIAGPAVAGQALSDLQKAGAPSAANLDALFDGLRPRAAADGLSRLRELRQVLSQGTPQSDGSGIGPFTFKLRDGSSRVAQSAGLEGFVQGEAAARGDSQLLHHLEDYGRYLEALLGPMPWAAGALEEIRGILASKDSPSRRYDRLTRLARGYAEGLRREAAALDRARWVRRARIYEIFPRAFNLDGRRRARGRGPGPGGPFFADFAAEDLGEIRDEGFDTLWVMGIFPIGRRNAFGTAGGSPYSVSDHEGIHPDLGTDADFKAFVVRAHAAGLRVIIDFIPNHTSMDSKLLLTRPEFFIHQTATSGQPPPRGFFEHEDPSTGRRLWLSHGGYDSYGRLEFWEDTAQVDYSREDARREMTRIALGWVSRFGVDGFRVDMAYQVLNSYFGRNWRRPMPRTEFLEELITAVKSVRPETAFIAEAYDGWDALAACGFDMVYGKNDMSRAGGHAGWYDALVSRDPARIQEALRRAEYLNWQSGGPDRLDFMGNHDEAGPGRAFGSWERGAAALTLLMPGGLLFYGSQEAGFDRPAPNEPKSIPFSVPVQVDWGADPQTAAFYGEVFKTSRRLRERAPDAQLKALPGGGKDWVGFALVDPSTDRAAALVLANPTNHAVKLRVNAWGASWEGELEPSGYRIAGPAFKTP